MCDIVCVSVCVASLVCVPSLFIVPVLFPPPFPPPPTSPQCIPTVLGFVCRTRSGHGTLGTTRWHCGPEQRCPSSSSATRWGPPPPPRTLSALRARMMMTSGGCRAQGPRRCGKGCACACGGVCVRSTVHGPPAELDINACMRRVGGWAGTLPRGTPTPWPTWWNEQPPSWSQPSPWPATATCP